MDYREWLKRGIVLLLAYLLYLWSWNHSIFAEEISNSGTKVLILKGYLGPETLAADIQDLDASAPHMRKLVLVINSTSGNLAKVLEFAKKVYQLKEEHGISVEAYIDDNAVGPAAVLPFLADDLYISLFISWGDIPLGNEKALPTNILRNQVISLINPGRQQAHLLSLVASAMSDPAIHIVDDKGWRLASPEADRNLPVISTKGETLVVNHNQVKEMGLAKGVMSLDKFMALHPRQPGSQQGAASTATEPSLQGQPMTEHLVEEELKKHIVFNPAGPNSVGHIIIEDRTSGISEATWLYVKKALETYKASKPIFVILELNTPGGEVFAAQEISDALKELDTQYNIPVVAYINNWAISAGAMLAYSCRFITTSKDGSMGAAEPVIQGETGKMEAASEKVNSAIRVDFANRARFFNRNPYIAEAMVDKDSFLVLRHGMIIRLDNEEQVHKYGPDADIVISPKGKLLTLGADKMLEYGVADLIIPPTKTNQITAQEKESGKWPADKMALFHLPFFKDIPNAVVDSYRMDWKTRFFVFLATPIVSSLLFLGLIVGAYLEINSPGVGIPAAVAFTCLFLIIISSFSLEIANWLELILLLVGLIVILVELFVLPTFGLLGFIGVIFFLAGLFGMMIPGISSVSFELDTQTFNAAGEVFLHRLAWLCGTLVAAFLIIAILARYVTPKFAAFRRFVLSGSEQTGYIAGDNPADLPPVGSRGEAASTLRPSGKIIIKDAIYDAVSSGAFIERGSPIEVVQLDGSVIIVRAMSEEQP